MTKKKNLTAFMIAIIVMLFSLPANAQGTVGYAQYDENSNTLTFYGGEMPTTGAYELYELNTGSNRPAWNNSVARNSCTKVVFDESFNDVRPTSCFQWFQGFSKLSTIEGIGYLNTDNVTTMQAMFDGCSGLTTLDVSKFNTAKVTYMNSMFQNCSGLTSLNLSNFNTANVTTMYNMFFKCSKLKSLDLSSFNTDKVTDMDNMFYGCSGLTSLDLSNFNTANVGLMYYMFRDCSGLTSLDLSSFNTAKVTKMSYMFNYCSKLTTIYVSDNFTPGMFIQSTGMFENCTKLEGKVKYDPGKTDKVMASYKKGYFKTYFTLGEKKVELCGENPLTAESLDLSGDYDFTPKFEAFTAKSATYTRDLSTSGSKWYTLCLPFAYTPNNFTAYQLKGATEKAVEIEEMTGEIDAGTPVLFKFKDGVDKKDKKINITATDAQIVKAPVVDGTTVSGPNGSSLQLCGTYQNKSFSEDDNNAFILLNNKLMNPAKMLENENVTKVGVKPFRAYMTSQAGTSAKSFSIGSGDEGTTAIDLLNSVATDDAEYYDINGRRIDAPAKGVNIVRRGNKTMKLIIK